jgi:hypothetical protein
MIVSANGYGRGHEALAGDGYGTLPRDRVSLGGLARA